MAEQKVPDTWTDSLKLLLMAVPLLTLATRWIAKYMKRSRIEEHKEWLRSEDGREFWKEYHRELEAGLQEEE